MIFTTKQTVDPAILNKELDDGMGTSKVIMNLKSWGFNTIRDVIVAGGHGLRTRQGFSPATIGKIGEWMEAKKLPWSHWGSISQTSLHLFSHPGTYEVSLAGVEKMAEESLMVLTSAGYSREVQASVPIISEDGSTVGTMKVTVTVEFE